MDLSVEVVGREREPLATLDAFADDADALRAAALNARFGPAGEHYPGVRANLPSTYLRAQLPIIANVITRHFARCRRIHVIDASFSIVSRRADELQVPQRLPHVDAYGDELIALVHHLSLEPTDGTAFFRHRSTGYETIDAARAPTYFGRLEEELKTNPPAPEYIADETPLFERTALAPARYNRAILYRSHMLHSGAISPGCVLSPDPAMGRLTITGFFAIE